MKNLLSILWIAIVCYSCNEAKTPDVAEAPKKRPNIIFIMADDHATQAISAYGHPISDLAPTPNIDRIANEGAIFKNNFNTNSICGPSRAVILTGKHSHINGFRMNGERFDGSQQTFPKLLQNAGYSTAVIGKWHLHGYPEGFDYWNILLDQGNYYNPDFISLKDGQAVADTTRVPGYATDLITEDAINFLDKAKDANKPFMLMLQHKAPHRNWMPALRHLHTYDAVEFPVPDTYFTDHEGSTASKEQSMTIYTDMYEGHDLKMTKKKGSPELAHNPWKTNFDRMTQAQRAEWDKAYQPKNDAFHEMNLKGKDLALWKLQRYLQDYMATIASVDEGVGTILDYLEANGLAENTIVVYTTDQGFYLGEKGWFDKRFMYEESLAMPMLMKYPNLITPGTEITALTQNLDFAETFLDMAGVPIPEDMQGKSMLPLFTKDMEDADFRDAIYYHYYDFPAFHMVKKMYGVRTKRYKLIHVYDDIDEWELYDLEKDPSEVHNLINDDDYNDIAEKLHKRLDALQKQYKVTDKEFEKVSPEAIKRNYMNFEKLRGKALKSYKH
ncbi:sulfatase [Subsaximicrobium wynnwilliamsii]|uniref:Sulfatase n=2 Tax=Subsaximicrobium wynnwilliamsii TaxID=291179 RepID=A0A5C6ZER7_9FLAO|nr:sulfatase [Subsaximicrobium wynnwilliamsii]TXD81991.1 sulfatase [Subsaximicrobium wynnwilliamsii]TXD87689.1 sulfatase [Subsaximicrobium wynnwilliamsii]TXE01436.1 sulfatase [Subsaximicrobium wynnwilliamsii]